MRRQLNKLILTDVSLRETIKPFHNFESSSLNKMQKHFKYIVQHKYPKNIEIGSLILPHMLDFDNLFHYSQNYIKYQNYKTNVYMAIPSTKKRILMAKNIGVKNISLLVPENNYDLNNNTDNITDNIIDIAKSNTFESIKLYMSCSNICNKTGKTIPTNIIAENICKYVWFTGISNISLYDTTNKNSPTYMLELLQYLKNENVPFSKIGLHLNRKIKSVPTNMHFIGGLSLANGINNIDVSNIINNGCLTTIGDSTINTNTNYDDLEAILSARDRVLMSDKLLLK
jgi:hypothetical protein